MQQPNQRGYRSAQGSSPMAIRTKKYQFDKNMYATMAAKQVWAKEWWYLLIPMGIFLLPAVFSFSWWWVAGAIVFTLLFALLRSAQVMGVTQAEQSNPLFERLSYEIDNRQLLLKRNEREGMALTWDMIQRARQKGDAYILWLQAPDSTQFPTGFKGWLARTFQVPVFLHLPQRIFNNPNDIKLFEAMLRRKNLIS